MNVSHSPTQELSRFASELCYSDIPPAVRTHIKRCLLDTLGCGIFGSTLPWGRILSDFVRRPGGRGESTLFGAKEKVSAPDAALANGTMIHGFELDDIHRTSILHPGSVTVPAALAVAESRQCTGRQFLEALVAGYEIGVRIGKGIGTSHLRRGYHPTGTHGTFAAAAAAGKLLGLGRKTMAHALGIAGTQAAGLMAAQYSAMVKRMHAGRASQSGVYAAFLAEMGLTGIPGILEADYGGYGSVMSDSPDLEAMTTGLGERFELLNVGFKRYSCCGSNFTSVEALSEIMKEQGLRAEGIRGINVRCTTASKLHVGWDYRPEGITAAQMNLAYCLAAMAREGEVFVDQFTEEKIRDPETLELIRRIHVSPDPELDLLGPDYRHAILCEVETEAGRSFQKRINFSLGSSDRPLGDDEIEGKFKNLAGRVLPMNKAESLLKAVQEIEDAPSLIELTRILC
jgi:aconitate decarboxylase